MSFPLISTSRMQARADFDAEGRNASRVRSATDRSAGTVEGREDSVSGGLDQTPLCCSTTCGR